MGFFDTPFTPDANEAQSEYSALPEGQYRLCCEKAELRKSKAGNEMLSLGWVVESPAEFAGRKLFSNLNLEHANPEVVKIATRQLHSLTLMAGIKSLTDPSELVACTITAKVKVKKREDTGEMQNEVVYAFKANGNPAVGPAKASTPAGPAPKPAGDW